METQEQQAQVQEPAEAATPTPAPAPAKVDPLQAQFQQAAERLGVLTLGLVQQREELIGRERTAESLAAEIVQRKARIQEQEQELLRVQGAVGALQQLQQTQQAGQEAGRE